MKTKYWLMIGVFVIAVSVGLILYDFPEKIDCNSYGAIFLKPSESTQSSKIADSLSVVVVVPEENKIIARTEILECLSFEYQRYINWEGYVV